MRTVAAIIYGGMALVFFAVGALLILGYAVPRGNTVYGFALEGLVTTWWGRAAAASLTMFAGTVLLLFSKRLLQGRRSKGVRRAL